MSSAAYSRDTTILEEPVLPEGLLDEWAFLVSRYGSVPNCEDGYWSLQDMKSEAEKLPLIIESVEKDNERQIEYAREWNIKSRFLLELGEEHPFVQGYIDKSSPSWLFLARQKSSTSEDLHRMQPRAFINWAVATLRQVWPGGWADSKSVAWEAGNKTSHFFQYNRKFPVLDDDIVQERRTLSEFVVEGRLL